MCSSTLDETRGSGRRGWWSRWHQDTAGKRHVGRCSEMPVAGFAAGRFGVVGAGVGGAGGGIILLLGIANLEHAEGNPALSWCCVVW